MLSEGCRKCLDDVGRGAGSAGMMSEGRPLRWAFNAPFKIVYHTEMAQKRLETKKLGGEIIGFPMHQRPVATRCNIRLE